MFTTFYLALSLLLLAVLLSDRALHWAEEARK
jgi:hypothetical protein